MPGLYRSTLQNWLSAGTLYEKRQYRFAVAECFSYMNPAYANFELCFENPAFGLQIVLQNDPGAAFAAVAGFGVAAGTKALIDFDELADGFPKDRAGSLCMYAFSVNNHNFL